MAGAKHIIDTSFLTQLDRYAIPLSRRVTAVHTGSHQSTRTGAGLDIIDHRKYNQGDSLKRIDWNLYARTEKLYIRRFEEDKNLNMVILLDASSSMLFPDNTPNKFEYAATVAAGVSYIVMKHNDVYTIATFADDVDYTKSHKGRDDFLRTIDNLTQIPVSGTTKLADCADSIYPRIKSKSMVLIMSDFLDNLDSVQKAVNRLSRHELVIVHIYDENEINLPESVDGTVKFIDSETGEEISFTVGAGFKKEYASEYSKHMAELEKIAYDFKIPYFRVSIKNEPFDTVLKIIGEG
ncbi:DUF58 domain-containing protein [Methanosarcina mazei]|uniref:DUF58 domain-containing protein n=5 Tax=Methanosarcina mazei TaxID=2209 RepID=A0A0F8LJL9_METMZ|nr:DUF58 domain-containing protein [Methanosarcina mazei]AAM32364.1 hypothetical protein MM_2668 [Methanosarcina mazei Go1]AKB40937.1 Cell division protein DivIC (FtsB), stabilizes FtsL against RasP cleavage [Methanosarcina mazei WWM610]AKB61889.1 Cell division protein DivIC (FtsB), stabilizes FtsL against RasP cleavage [Methanosarcina mazei SarPi]AKB65231.1 Cell division protein DivIC (FtsB), stabilizes FtsL against RasP cleavage [Methanosarcina mazei S-6]KKG03742.1 hypothetical protein DU47_